MVKAVFTRETFWPKEDDTPHMEGDVVEMSEASFLRWETRCAVRLLDNQDSEIDTKEINVTEKPKRRYRRRN